MKRTIKIEEVRKIVNDLYHDCQEFDSLSPTYPDRMRSQYYKESILSVLRRFCNTLDTQFLLIEREQIKND